MASKTSLMNVGDTYKVRAGDYAGRDATIIDPTAFPDSDMERRRKITVEIDGQIVYLLPRVLDVPSFASTSSAGQQRWQQHGQVTESRSSRTMTTITDMDDPRLDPWRPDPSIVKQYVNRTLVGDMKDTDFLLSLWRKRRNVCLVGDTQAGKTMLVQVLAVLAGKERGGKPLPVFTLSASGGITEMDLFGQCVPFHTFEEGERLVDLPGVVDMAARAGGILYLDEVNMMSERVTSALHSLCDHRRAFVNRQRAVRFLDGETETFMPEVITANENLWVFATVNPSGYRGTAPMNEAFTNRFMFVPFGYDDDVEKKLVPSNAVRMLGLALREARASRSLSTPVGTAALAELCENIDTYGVEPALWLFTAMFQPQEIPKVEAIITDRSIAMLIDDEQKAKVQNAVNKATALTDAEPSATERPEEPVMGSDDATAPSVVSGSPGSPFAAPGPITVPGTPQTEQEPPMAVSTISGWPYPSVQPN